MDREVAWKSVNWSRKTWHVVGGITAIALAYYLPWPWTFLVALGTLLWWVTAESLRRREPWFGRLFITLSSPFIRHFERRRLVGNTWFALAASILTVLFHDRLLLAASFIGWTFGDPAAEIVGRLVPSKKFFDNEKSIAGTLACFVISALAYLGFFWLLGTGGDIISAALIGAVATTLAETISLSFSVNDNFLIPLICALAFSFVLR